MRDRGGKPTRLARPRAVWPPDCDGPACPSLTKPALVQKSAERAKLEKLPDRELLRRAARALAVDVTLVGEAVLRQPQIFTDRSGEVAVLVRALAGSVRGIGGIRTTCEVAGALAASLVRAIAPPPTETRHRSRARGKAGCEVGQP